MRWLETILARRRAARTRHQRLASLYAEVVEEARDPDLFRRFRLPDTVDVRFELLALAVLLRSRALARQGREGEQLAQALVDWFFSDLDRNLREMGVSDLAIARRMRDLAGTWLARARDAGAALDAGNASALAAVLRRNLGHASEHADLEGLAALAVARNAALPPATTEPGATGQRAPDSPNSTRSR